MKWIDRVSLPVLLALVAMVSPLPWWPTDRDVYERMGRDWVIPNCNDIHCFRPMVSLILGRLPGPSLVVWKSYAVLCQVGAGVSMAYWVRRQGAAPHAARQVAWLTALGSGACYTLFDPYTSDPLMHLFAPLTMIAIDRGSFWVAGATSVVGVIAKEFAAVPLVVAAAWRGVQARWEDARALALTAAVVIGVWAGWQVFARSTLRYTTGLTYSDDFTTGGYVVFWLLELSTTLVVTQLAMTLGGLWVLWAAGLLWGSRPLRQLTFASLPAILIFIALQQPERALWNFAFILMPAAAVVLSRVPPSLGWGFVAAQTLLNARYGGQVQQLPPARYAFVAATVIAIALIWQARSAPPLSREVLNHV
jgi:hypothetical protein